MSDIFVFSFSMYLLFSLVLQSVVDVGVEVNKLLVLFDFISCIVFLYDWIVRLIEDKSKFKYIINPLNIIDLVASIPFMFFSNYMGYFKIIRLLRVVKIIKTSISIFKLHKDVAENKKYFLKMLFLTLFIAIMVISPIMILVVEKDVGNIKTAEDAIWWTYCTISTIGYGDKYPVTSLGRIVTVFVSLGGITLFGIAGGILVSYFFSSVTTVKESKKEE